MNYLYIQLKDNTFIEINGLNEIEIIKSSNEKEIIKENFAIPVYNYIYIFKGQDTSVSIYGKEIKYIKIQK